MSGAVEGVALLPCPFCGRPAEIASRGMSWRGDVIEYTVECAEKTLHCPASRPGLFHAKREWAITAWNTRTTPPARSYADGIADAAKHLDERAERARVAAIGGGMDPVDAELLDYEYSNAAAAIRLLSQGEKA